MNTTKDDLDAEACSLGWLLDAIRDTNLLHYDGKSFGNLPPDITTVLNSTHVRIHRVARSLFDTHSTIEQMIVAKQMASIFPWRNRKISKTQHLTIIRFSFINLCYLYETRVKQFANSANSASMVLLGRRITNPAQLISQAKAGLRPHIQARGEMFHQWSLPYEPIDFFGMVEYAARANLPYAKADEYRRNLAGLHRAAKADLATDIQDAIEFARSNFLQMEEYHKNDLIALFSKYGEVVRFAKESPEKLMITQPPSK